MDSFEQLRLKVHPSRFNFTMKMEKSGKYFCNQNPETLKCTGQEIFDTCLSNLRNRNGDICLILTVIPSTFRYY